MIKEFFQSVSADLSKPDKSMLPPKDQNELIPDQYILIIVEKETLSIQC